MDALWFCPHCGIRDAHEIDETAETTIDGMVFADTSTYVQCGCCGCQFIVSLD